MSFGFMKMNLGKLKYKLGVTRQHKICGSLVVYQQYYHN